MCIEITQWFNTHGIIIIRILNQLLWRIKKDFAVGQEVQTNCYMVKQEIDKIGCFMYIYYTTFSNLEIKKINIKCQ